MKKLVFILITVLYLAGNSSGADEIMTLLTDEEGAMKDAPSDLVEIGMPLNNGPDIEVVVPEMHSEYISPIKINVLFIPEEDKKVDLSKLKVECLKFITIDLTDRVLPYATPEGIKVENAKLPKGEHKLRVTVGDKSGGITEEVFKVKIVK